MRIKFLEDEILADKRYFRGMQYEAELIDQIALSRLFADGKVRLIEDIVTTENLIAAKECLEREVEPLRKGKKK
jgi:hypothetical protein